MYLSTSTSTSTSNGKLLQNAMQKGLMISLLRHAESEYNVDNTINVKDCDLSIIGKKQASQLVGSFDYILVSPLKRALHTLALSKITGKNIETYPDLREIKKEPCDYFEHEDCTTKEPNNKNDQIYIEPENLVVERINNVISYILQIYNSQKTEQYSILLIGHADWFWLFTSYNINGTRYGKWLNNAESIDLS